MKKCIEIREMLSFYLDNELHENERKQVVKHLETCSDCKAELELLKNLIDYASDVDEIELPEGYGEKLHIKLVEAAKELHETKPARKTNAYRWGSLVAGITVLFVGLSSGYFGQFQQKTESEIAYVRDVKLDTVDKAAMNKIDNNQNNFVDAVLENTRMTDVKQNDGSSTQVTLTPKAKRNVAPAAKEITPVQDQTATPVYEMADNSVAQKPTGEQPQALMKYGEQPEADSNAKIFSTAASPEDVDNTTNIQENIILVIDASKTSVDSVFSAVEQNAGKIEESQILKSYSPNNTFVDRSFVIEVSKENYEKILGQLGKLGTIQDKEGNTNVNGVALTKAAENTNVVINLTVKSSNN